MTKFIHISDLDSTITVVHHDDTQGTLKALQTLVDGFIDYVHVPAPNDFGFPFDIIVNDEGLYRPDFTINLVASVLAGRHLVGPAVISKANKNGRTIGLSASEIAKISEIALVTPEELTPQEIAAERALAAQDA